MKYYAGIGSRETPEDILSLMSSIARGLYRKGYTLRTGGAPGADQAFEWGLWDIIETEEPTHEPAQIFLPWPNFEIKNRTLIEPCLTEPTQAAYSIAGFHHPRFQYLKFPARKLIARNTHQIYGPNIDEENLSEFVICWTKGAKGGGGTGQAIRIAEYLRIPVYDLADPQQLFELKVRLDGSFII